MAGKKKRKKKKIARPRGLMKAAKPEPLGTTAPSPQSQTGTAGDFLKGRYSIICLALIALVGVLVYSNSFNVPFVFDDVLNIVDNNDIRGIGSAFIDSLRSRVVGFLTFALNYKINGLDVAGYHVFNLAIHLINALLVFWLVSLTLKTPFFKGSRLGESRSVPLMLTLFAGLIFVAHPVQTQAVTYTVQRFTSLATLFYLLSLSLYAKWRMSLENPEAHNLFGFKITVDLEVKKGFFYICSLVSALLAMLTKEIAFTLPAVIALWEFSFFNGSVKRRIINLLPFALTMPVIPLVLIFSDAPLLVAMGATEPPPAGDYFLTQGRVIVTYLRLFFLPVNQNLDYDYPVYQSLFNLNVLLSFVFLLAIAGIGAFLWRYSKKRGELALLRLTAFGIFWFFITLSVESSFITIADVIFEHRLYLPSVGLIFAVVAGIAVATTTLKKRLPSIHRVVIPLAAVIVVALAVATYERNRVWGGPITLWEDTARKSPGKARPHNNLGVFYKNSGQLDRAEAEYSLAIDLMPNYALAHNNLGVLYGERGQLDKAEAEFKQAIDLMPDYAAAFYNLGMNYVKGNRYADAIYPFNKVIELNPGDYEAHNNLGNIYVAQKRYDKALAEYQAALMIKPDYQEARDKIQILESMMS